MRVGGLPGTSPVLGSLTVKQSASDTLQWPANFSSSTLKQRVASALQSRGGDGLIAVGLSIGWRGTDRLPEHEVCGEGEGPVARCWFRVAAKSKAAKGLTRKSFATFGQER